MAKLAIERALKQAGMKPGELARRLKKDPSNLNKLLKEGWNPTFETLNAVAKAIGCKVKDLLKE